MLSKSLIQFSVDGQGWVSSVIDLRPNYGGGDEDNGDVLQRPHGALLHSVPRPRGRPPPTYASTGDSWTLRAKSGSVSCGVTAPFSWVLVHTRFCLCPPRVYFAVLCKFWLLYGWVNGDLPQEDLCHSHSQSQTTANLYLHRRYSNTVLSQSLWDPWVLMCTRFV